MTATETTENNSSEVPSMPVLQGTPPPFGHSMLQCFAFDPKYTNLNHGSYGSLPRHVRLVTDKLTDEIEWNPDLFMRFTYQPRLLAVRERLAKMIGAKASECVIVPNATHGINTVLRNCEWDKDDVIIHTNVTYHAVQRTAAYLSDVKPNPSVSVFTINFPTTPQEILNNFRAHIEALPRRAGRRGRVIAIIDSLASNPGALLPWKEMVKICREESIWSVVDAAHSIGQEPNINLGEVQPDFWVSNCHKWLYAKRGCAVLYVPERHQHLIMTTLPTSHYYVSPPKHDNASFLAQFEWCGTRDFAPYLSVGAALDFREWIGGEARINEYCNGLAKEGGKRLAEILGTSVMDPNGEFTCHMVNVELPLPASIEFSWEIDGIFRERLLKEWNVYVAHFYHNGRWWARCSAQIWNEVSDFEVVGKALNQVCAEVKQTFGGSEQSKE